ncbi:MAG: XdhC family protein [Steroidobacteraceae bacterium]
METQITPLLPLYRRERAAHRALALAIVFHTRGSTYRKPGALMAIAADGSYAGLLSGGCLESDLREHAAAVIASGSAEIVTYNTGGSDDALWGLGIGCEGAMEILLARVGPDDGWQPLTHLAQALDAHRSTTFGVVVESRLPGIAAGAFVLPGRTLPHAAAPDTAPAAPAPTPAPTLAPVGAAALGPVLAAEAESLLERVGLEAEPGWLESSGLRLLALPLALPPRLLLLGGGPDALPIVDFASRLAWKVTVYDHRPSYAERQRFPAAERVILARPEELAHTLDLASFDAAVVMSHHMPSDLEYLRALGASRIGYAGLLGPAHRREKLLGDLGSEAQSLRGRLHAPVGLDLGGRTPESIALGIVAEIHAHLHPREGGTFGERPEP